jgi:uncharacterized membrane protein
MIWYFLGVSLHILAAVLWIGQVIYRLAVVEPLIKRWGPLETPLPLQNMRDKLSWIGWPCLLVTVITGIFILYYQGVTLQEFGSGHLFLGSFGQRLRAKLVLTAALVVLQFFVGPRRIILEWLLALIGLTIIGLSALLIR